MYLRNEQLPAFSKHFIYYRRCAREARNKGMSTFSIQNYGDCYSGEQAAATYYQEGEQRYFSDSSQPKPWLGCLDVNKQECHSNNLECGGQERTNYVYTLESGKHGILNMSSISDKEKQLDKSVSNNSWPS